MTSISTPNNKAKKAAMLSGLILPGLGQVYLGEKVKGSLMIAGVLGFLGYFLYKFASGFSNYFKVALDPNLLLGGADGAPVESISAAFFKGVLLGALPAVVIWVYSAVEAYQAGKRIDERESARRKVLTGRP